MYNSKIKICGIKDIATLECCIKKRVDFFGLIFYSKSPRYIELNEALNLISYASNKAISSVGVFVNEPIDQLNEILKKIKLNFIQLHGDEDSDYMINIKKNNSVKIIKKIAVNNKEDLVNIKKYLDADMLLFDYKPTKDELPGGNSKTFNWDLIKLINIDKPWFLSGGININNINDIQKYTIPYGIDISSGVEDSPGEKNIEKIISLLDLYGKQ